MEILELPDIKTSQAARIKEVVGHCLDEDYYKKAAYSTKLSDYIKETLNKMYIDPNFSSMLDKQSTLESYIEKSLDNIEN